MTNTDRVLTCLKDQADLFFGLETIAERTGLSISQTNQAVQALKGMDAVLTKRERIRGGRTRELYRYRAVVWHLA